MDSEFMASHRTVGILKPWEPEDKKLSPMGVCSDQALSQSLRALTSTLPAESSEGHKAHKDGAKFFVGLYMVTFYSVHKCLFTQIETLVTII